MIDMTQTIVPKSDQLNADDLIAGPLTIRITRVTASPESPEQPVSIFFDGDNGKPYKPCKSIRRVMVAAWGPDASTYVGRAMTLYRDPKVQFGGMQVGGIRVSHMSHIDADMTMALTVTKAKRAAYTVKVLREQPRQTPPADASSAATLTEARAVARKGKAAFAEWWTQNPDKRAAAKTILPELQRLCAEADAISADPFGLPPVDATQPTDAEIQAQIAAELAERDRALEGGV